MGRISKGIRPNYLPASPIAPNFACIPRLPWKLLARIAYVSFLASPLFRTRQAAIEPIYPRCSILERV